MDDTGWRSLFKDPKGLFSLFQGVPDFVSGTLAYVHIDERDSKSITLGFEMVGLPVYAPALWVDNGFNGFDCSLLFTGVTEVDLRAEAAGAAHMVEFIKRSSEELQVTVNTAHEEICFMARVGEFLSVKPYLSSREP